MVRVTQAQKIEQGNEQQALTFFERTLGTLPDPRRARCPHRVARPTATLTPT